LIDTADAGRQNHHMTVALGEHAFGVLYQRRESRAPQNSPRRVGLPWCRDTSYRPWDSRRTLSWP
jgi:hypothetical protein